MDIKIGDRVRIKTEQELLLENWSIMYGHQIMESPMGDIIWSDQLDYIGEITDLDDDSGKILIDNDFWIRESLIAEILPQTLDKYILQLSLEERAKYFISYNECSNWWSTITEMDYDSYEKALQATIEALKQPKGEK